MIAEEIISKQRSVLAWNGTWILLTGTLICFWVWRNTDLFEELAAILTLSGALSWLAVILKILPEDKVKELQGSVFTSVFENPKLRIGGPVLFGTVLAGTFCAATVQLEPWQETLDRAIIVYPLENSSSATNSAGARPRSGLIAEEDFEMLKPSGRVRLIVPVWFQTRPFVVKVSGYPDKVITLHPWEREELIAPHSFRRRVVLLQPSNRLINHAREARANGTTWKLFVQLDSSGTPLEMPLDGHAVWLGCDSDVQVPPATRAALEQVMLPTLTPYCFYPQAFTNGPADLDGRKQFKVWLETGAGAAQPPMTKLINDVPARADFFPQVVEVDSVN